VHNLKTIFKVTNVKQVCISSFCYLVQLWLLTLDLNLCILLLTFALCFNCLAFAQSSDLT